MLYTIFFTVASLALLCCESYASNYCSRNDGAMEFPYEIKTVPNSVDGTPLYSHFVKEGEYVGRPMTAITFTRDGAVRFIKRGLITLKDYLKALSLGRIDVALDAVGITMHLENLVVEKCDFGDVELITPFDGYVGYGHVSKSNIIVTADYRIHSTSFVGKIFEDQGSIQLSIADFDLSTDAVVFLGGQENMPHSSLGESFCPYHFSFSPIENTVKVKIERMFIKFIVCNNGLVSTILSALVDVVKTTLESTFGDIFFGAIFNKFIVLIADENNVRMTSCIDYAYDGRFTELIFKDNNLLITMGGMPFNHNKKNKKFVNNYNYLDQPIEVENYTDFYKLPEEELDKYTFDTAKVSVADLGFTYHGIPMINAAFYTIHSIRDSFFWNGDTIRSTCSSWCPPRCKGEKTDGKNVLERSYFDFSYVDPDGRTIYSDEYKDLFLVKPLDSVDPFYTRSFVREYAPTEILDLIPEDDRYYAYTFRIPEELERAPKAIKVGANGTLSFIDDVVITVSSRQAVEEAYTPLYTIKTDIYFVVTTTTFKAEKEDATVFYMEVRQGYLVMKFYFYSLVKERTKMYDMDGNEIQLGEKEFATLLYHIKVLMRKVAAPYLTYLATYDRNDGIIKSAGVITMYDIPFFSFPLGDYYEAENDPRNGFLKLGLNFKR